MRGLVRSIGKFKKYSFKNNSHRAKLPLHDRKACEQDRSFCPGFFIIVKLMGWEGVGPGCIFISSSHFSELRFQPRSWPRFRREVGTCHRHGGASNILPGDQVLPFSDRPRLPAQEGINSQTEIVSLHALSFNASLLSSGVVKKSRPARHCVNETVKRPK